MEGGVVGDECCDVGGERAICDIGFLEGASGGCFIQSNGSDADVLGEGQEGIDYVDGTTSEIVIL